MEEVRSSNSMKGWRGKRRLGVNLAPAMEMGKNQAKPGWSHRNSAFFNDLPPPLGERGTLGGSGGGAGNENDECWEWARCGPLGGESKLESLNLPSEPCWCFWRGEHWDSSPDWWLGGDLRVRSTGPKPLRKPLLPTCSKVLPDLFVGNIGALECALGGCESVPSILVARMVWSSWELIW